MNILLFGAKGQVGQEIGIRWQGSGLRIFGYDVDDVDIVDKKAVASVFAKHNEIDIVINAAAYTAVDKAEEEKDLAFSVNRDGVKNIAECCKNRHLPMLHISTDYVFDGTKEGAYTEDDKPNPLGVYGASKLAGDEALQSILPEHVILRVSWVFGQYGNNFVKTILRLASERDTLGIVGDQRGCPTPAADIARVLLEIAERISNGDAKWGLYNYCGSPLTTWCDFTADIVKTGRAQGKKFAIKTLNRITTADYPLPATRPANSELKIEKIIRDYGITRHEWQQYLEKMIDAI